VWAEKIEKGGVSTGKGIVKGAEGFVNGLQR